MHATRLSTSRSFKASHNEIAASHRAADYAFLSVLPRYSRFPEATVEIARLWDPLLLERLHAPLTRFHE